MKSMESVLNAIRSDSSTGAGTLLLLDMTEKHLTDNKLAGTGTDVIVRDARPLRSIVAAVAKCRLAPAVACNKNRRQEATWRKSKLINHAVVWELPTYQHCKGKPRGSCCRSHLLTCTAMSFAVVVMLLLTWGQ